jgi:hypothetical protein
MNIAAEFTVVALSSKSSMLVTLEYHPTISSKLCRTKVLDDCLSTIMLLAAAG